MAIQLDHLIVNVNDINETVDFWSTILGVTCEGETGPFTVIRITPELTFQLVPWGTEGGAHFAFSLPKSEFELVFSRIKNNNIPYGDSYHSVGTQTGPSEEEGARGMGKAVYFNDPNQHLMEIRYYE